MEEREFKETWSKTKSKNQKLSSISSTHSGKVGRGEVGCGMEVDGY
jgi:hypothetical protein